MDACFTKNETLSARLLSLLNEKKTEKPVPQAPPVEKPVLRLRAGEALRDADAIVAHIEVDNRHGTGVLLKRLFGGYENILSLRSHNYYDGRQDFGQLDFCIAHPERSLGAAVAGFKELLKGHTVGRILCTPYFPDDVLTALALNEIYGAPICTFIMDDQNVCTHGIPDEMMAELLKRSAFRLGISAELTVAYELKYGLPFWLMPPVIDAAYILSDPIPEPAALDNRNPGVIVGNIWGQHWLELLRTTVRESGITLHWYSNDYFRFLKGKAKDLSADGIITRAGPALGNEELIRMLRKTPYVVVPVGTMGDDDDRSFIAQLSFPSRIPFIMATSHTPVLILGSEKSPAARFVKETGIGLVTGYGPGSFRTAVETITDPATNRAMRLRALAVAGRFTDTGAAEWIWQSLRRGEPIDNRYEGFVNRSRPDLEQLVEQSRQGRKQ